MEKDVEKSKPIKVRFSGGYDAESSKFKSRYGYIEQYLLGEVVEVRTTRSNKLIRLYKSEYNIVK